MGSALSYGKKFLVFLAFSAALALLLRSTKVPEAFKSIYR